MMFVDESGDPGLPPDGDWANWGGSLSYDRVGVIIHGWKWKNWNNRIVELKSRYGLEWNNEIKAADIRRRKNSFAHWDRARRADFGEELLRLIGDSDDITLIGISINKRKISVGARARTARPEVRSMELLLERYNGFLGEQSDKSGIVILDPVNGISDDNLRYFQSYLQEKSANLHPLRIVEGTFFAKSHTSNLIQVADICSNIFYRREKAPLEFARIEPRFWLRDGRQLEGAGIKEWPT